MVNNELSSESAKTNPLRASREVVLSAARRTSNGTTSSVKSAKTNPLYPRNCCVFMEAGGAPPPVAQRDRLSSVRHVGRRSQRATSAPATFFDSLRLHWRSASAAARSRKKEREKGQIIKSAKTNPLWRSRRNAPGRPLAIFAVEYQTKPNNHCGIRLFAFISPYENAGFNVADRENGPLPAPGSLPRVS